MTVTARVTNTGARAGDEVAELYLRPAPDNAVRAISADQPMPRLELAGFARFALNPGQSTRVKFVVTPDQLLLVDAKGDRDLQPGDWRVYVGPTQPSPESATANSGILTGTVTVK